MQLPSSQLPYRMGRYELQAEIGRGAYATVYRARLTGPMGFQKKVALKLARSPLTEAPDDDEGRIKALVNEARIGGRLQHPNIVEIYEFGRIEGFYFIAMEFVDGLTIGQMLEVMKIGGRAMPAGVAVEVVAQACRGLAYAHDLTDEAGNHHRVVHRDLKPANLMVGRTGLVKIMDFGIAKSAISLFQTAEGLTKGTPMYMSPEQVYGRPVTPASDIFAIGSILFEMVTGEPLFLGDSVVEIIEKVAEEDSTPRLERMRYRLGGMVPVLSRCLAKHPRQRYSSAEQLLIDVEALRAEFPMIQSTAALLQEIEAIRAAGTGVAAPRLAPAVSPPPPSRFSPPPIQLDRSSPSQAEHSLELEPNAASSTIEILVEEEESGPRDPFHPSMARSAPGIPISPVAPSTTRAAPGPTTAPPPPFSPPPASPFSRPSAPVRSEPPSSPNPGGVPPPAERRRSRPGPGSWSVVLPAMGPEFVPARPAGEPPPRGKRPPLPPPSEPDLAAMSLELVALPPLKPGRD